MCSAALLCDTSWSANQELQGSRNLNSDQTQPDKNEIEDSSINETKPQPCVSVDSVVITRMLINNNDDNDIDVDVDVDEDENVEEDDDDDDDEEEEEDDDEEDDEDEDLNDTGTKTTINIQQVARHDSGVPEDLVSPGHDDKNIENYEENDDDDPNETLNSDFNVTVIHVKTDKNSPINDNNETNDFTIPQESHDNENSTRDFTPDSKDSKDGSDSGVEGCANELPRVEYASSCNGLDEVSCGSSLVSCCSVYEDPCAILPDDSRQQHNNNSPSTIASCSVICGEGTSEGGSESSSLAGSFTGPRTGRATSLSAKRGSFASSSSGNVSSTMSKRKIDSKGINSSNDNSRSSATPRTKIRSNSTSVAATTTQTTTMTGSMTGSMMTTSVTTPRATSSSSSSRNSTTSVTSRDRGRSRDDRSSSRDNNQSNSTTGKFRVTTSAIQNNVNLRTRTRQLPDSLPSSLTTEIDRDLAAQRGRINVSTKSRISSIGANSGSSSSSCSRVNPRLSTPGSTPCDDTRKTLVSGITRNFYNSRDDRSIETYATLPRAKNRGNFSIVRSNDRTDDNTMKFNDSNRVKSRENSLNRGNSIKKPPRQSTTRESTSLSAGRKCLTAHTRITKGHEKVRIYHEIGSQTGITGNDIEKILSGIVVRQHDPENIERKSMLIQTDESWEDLRKVEKQLKILIADSALLRQENERLESEKVKIENLLADERADHNFARKELEKNARRVVAMLGTPQSENNEASDSFLELETHFQSSGQVVANQQIEISDLQSLCRMLNRDLEKSLAAQKSLLQQQQELEAESAEMQDFLQDEKATLVEALKDAENEIGRKNELLAQRDIELARLTEECKQLVRMSEQRRQENLSLGMKLNAVERRGRELLLGQGAAVSGASVALSGLGTRLEGLVDQLVRSYKISEKDLEDVVYHNEAYSRSNSSAESSPVSSKQSLKECTPSPKRGSFVSAVIGAIRNAATHPFAIKTITDKKSSPIETTKHIFKELSTESSSDLLDFETEPCLMMESVLEDVPLPDTYSHNMISSSDSLRRALSVPEPIDEENCRITRNNDDCTSLTNLTQAILNRRKAEDEEEVGDCDSQSGSEGCCGTETNSTAPITEYCPAVNLVDQVIDVDNLVTKLLKVLRIIQLDNDTCIRDLRDDKSELETKLEANSSELEELRKAAGDMLDSDEIFADAVDYRRRTVVENLPGSNDLDETIQNTDEEQKTND